MDRRFRHHRQRSHVEQAGSLYESIVLADGPIGFWMLDEPSGTVGDDLTSGGNDVNYINTPTLAVAGPGSAIPHGITFSAVSTEVANTLGVLPSNFTVAAGADWTMEIWLDWSDVGTTTRTAMIWRERETSDPWTVTGVLSAPTGSTAGRVSLIVPNSAGSGFITISSDGWNDGNWHHVVGRSVTGGDLSLWIDGVSRATSATARYATASGTRWVRAGSNYDTGPTQFWSGSAAAMAVYDTDLSDEQIVEHYDTGSVT